jgi:Flp pilus assembly protein TadD
VWESDAAPAAFRPGRRLDQYQHVFWPRAADSLRQFTMASHPARLRMSACFQESHEAGSGLPTMTCLSCHNPHLGIRTVPRERYNATCTSCHREDRAPACTEPSVVRAGGSGDCVSCHMPTAPTTDIPNVTVTDHYIRVVERDPPPPTGGPFPVQRVATVVGRNATDLQVAQGLLTYFEEVTNRPGVLDSAAVRLERAGRSEPAARLLPALARLHFLRGDHAALRALARRPEAAGVDDAWTHYRFGEAFASAGDHAGALRHLGRAVALAPGHLRFRERLARAHASAGRPADARGHYDTVLAADPTFEAAYNNRGMALLALGDLTGAEADFERAIDLDPDAEMALANLASLYYNTGRPALARPLLRRAMDLSPANEGYLRMWEALEEPAAGHARP